MFERRYSSYEISLMHDTRGVLKRMLKRAMRISAVLEKLHEYAVDAHGTMSLHSYPKSERHFDKLFVEKERLLKDTFFSFEEATANLKDIKNAFTDAVGDDKDYDWELHEGEKDTEAFRPSIYGKGGNA